MIYDIIVIGLGPAGSTFAREVSKSKKIILAIDGENINNKKPCGGLLAPDAQKELAHYDLVIPSNVLVSPQIFSVKTIDLNTVGENTLYKLEDELYLEINGSISNHILDFASCAKNYDLCMGKINEYGSVIKARTALQEIGKKKK